MPQTQLLLMTRESGHLELTPDCFQATAAGTKRPLGPRLEFLNKNSGIPIGRDAVDGARLVTRMTGPVRRSPDRGHGCFAGGTI